MQPTIRAATVEDLPAIGEMAAQLGYPVDTLALQGRFESCVSRPDHLVLVAEADGRVVGYIHAALRHDLVYPAYAEVLSLCVEETARGNGIGPALLAQAEDWARDQQAAGLTLGTSQTRQQAHRFYEREGFHLEKVQRIYKRLV